MQKNFIRPTLKLNRPVSGFPIYSVTKTILMKPSQVRKPANGRVVRICTSFIDVPDRIAVAIYFAGCSIRCKGCQNPELWNKASGVLVDSVVLIQKIKMHPFADSAVFLGGEPTDQCNFLLAICRGVSLFKVMYTGREFEELSCDLKNELDMIICGPYRQDLYIGGFPASSNQRVLKKQGMRWICQNYR